MPSLFEPQIVALLIAFILVAVVSLNRTRRSLPPGPKGLPILGNIFDVPKEFEWLAYARWSRQYGNAVSPSSKASADSFCEFIGSDVIYLNLAGTPVIVVNSAHAAHELFEKRSSLYSDRCA